jgi:hypothetical protein
MSFTVPLPPRTQLYHRSCSNKHTHLLEASRTVLRGGELQMELVELFKYQTLPSVSAEPLSPAADRNVGSLKALVTGFPGVAAPTMPPRLPTLYLTVAAEKARPSQSRPRPFTTLIPSLPPSPCLTRPYTCRTWNIVLVEWNALRKKIKKKTKKTHLSPQIGNVP